MPMALVLLAASMPGAGAAENWTAVPQLERLQRIDDWLSQTAGAPAHWRVRSKGDVAGNGKILVESHQKEVNLSWFHKDAKEDAKEAVIVKALHKGGHFDFGHRESDIAYFELLYLEFLRGEPGIPVLHGGWVTKSHVVWVTSHGGRSVGSGLGRTTDPVKMAKDYDRRARKHPIEVAKAWFRCFRSFGERGGFVLTDFKPEQFTLDPAGDIYLVDGPAPNSGPIAEFARRHYRSKDAVYADHIWVPGDKKLPRHDDLEPGRSWPCPTGQNTDCARRSYKQHHCADGHCESKETVGAPEIRACHDGTCDAFDWRVHVYDVAVRSWLLPRIIGLAKDRGAARRLEELSAAMRRHDPGDRPSFDDLLRKLDAW